MCAAIGYSRRICGRRRIGQGTFKSLILDAYGRQCAVTRERALPALDAAHIRDYSDRPEHSVRNGLLLATSLMRCPLGRVNSIRDDFNDGENYLRLQGEGIVVPGAPEWRPDPAALAWHDERRYRG